MPQAKAPATKLPKQASRKIVEPKKKAAVGVKVPVYDVRGKMTDELVLPKDMFGATVNPTLMAQAVRVYLANQRAGSADTQTRGEVTGSTRKIWRQKGTGRARHGAATAPIFVHGGVAHGPKPQDYSLKLPKKMKRLALFSALTTKVKENEVKVVTSLVKIEPKTKILSKFLTALALSPKTRKVLFVHDGAHENVTRAVRNLKGVTYLRADQLNTYEVLQHRQVLFMKEAIDMMQGVFGVKEKKARE